MMCVVSRFAMVNPALLIPGHSALPFGGSRAAVKKPLKADRERNAIPLGVLWDEVS